MTSTEQIIENGNFIALLAEFSAQVYTVQTQDVQISHLKSQLLERGSHDYVIQVQNEQINQLKTQLEILEREVIES